MRNSLKYSVFIVLVLSASLGFSQSNKELRMLIRYQDTIKLKEFMDDGFDINSTFREYSGESKDKCLLNLAAWRGSYDLTKYILKQPQTQILRVDKHKNTTLHYLVDKGWYDLAKKLIDSGVSPNTLGNRNWHILRMVLNRYQWTDNPSSPIVSLEFIKYLYSKNIEPNLSIACCKKETTILILGVNTADLATVEFLFSKHSETINLKDYDGLTALHWAVKSNQLDIVKFLLKKGARIDITDNKGKTPLDFALKLNDAEMTNTLKTASNS